MIQGRYPLHNHQNFQLAYRALKKLERGIDDVDTDLMGELLGMRDEAFNILVGLPNSITKHVDCKSLRAVVTRMIDFMERHHISGNERLRGAFGIDDHDQLEMNGFLTDDIKAIRRTCHDHPDISDQTRRFLAKRSLERTMSAEEARGIVLGLKSLLINMKVKLEPGNGDMYQCPAETDSFTVRDITIPNSPSDYGRLGCYIAVLEFHNKLGTQVERGSMTLEDLENNLSYRSNTIARNRVYDAINPTREIKASHRVTLADDRKIIPGYLGQEGPYRPVKS